MGGRSSRKRGSCRRSTPFRVRSTRRTRDACLPCRSRRHPRTRRGGRRVRRRRTARRRAAAPLPRWRCRSPASPRKLRPELRRRPPFRNADCRRIAASPSGSPFRTGFSVRPSSAAAVVPPGLQSTSGIAPDRSRPRLRDCECRTLRLALPDPGSEGRAAARSSAVLPCARVARTRLPSQRSRFL